MGTAINRIINDARLRAFDVVIKEEAAGNPELASLAKSLRKGLVAYRDCQSLNEKETPGVETKGITLKAYIALMREIVSLPHFNEKHPSTQPLLSRALDAYEREPQMQPAGKTQRTPSETPHVID